MSIKELLKISDQVFQLAIEEMKNKQPLTVKLSYSDKVEPAQLVAHVEYKILLEKKLSTVEETKQFLKKQCFMQDVSKSGEAVTGWLEKEELSVSVFITKSEHFFDQCSVVLAQFIELDENMTKEKTVAFANNYLIAQERELALFKTRVSN